MTPAKVQPALPALPIVRVAAVELAFCTMGVPKTVALELRALTTTLCPPNERVPVLPALNVTMFSKPAVLLSAPALPTTTFPELTIRPPVKILEPASVRRPGPDLVRAVLPPLLAMVEAMVRPFRVLLWMTVRSLLAPPASVPPVMVERLLPTALLTKMPPVVMTLVVPVRVMVLAAAALKRRLLAVMAASSAPARPSTSMLLFR